MQVGVSEGPEQSMRMSYESRPGILRWSVGHRYLCRLDSRFHIPTTLSLRQKQDHIQSGRHATRVEVMSTLVLNSVPVHQ